MVYSINVWSYKYGLKCKIIRWYMGQKLKISVIIRWPVKKDLYGHINTVKMEN